MGRITTRRGVHSGSLADGSADGQHAPAEVRVREDELAVEEPLEIRVGGQSLAVTMRTPGHDVELAAGFLVSEGIISAREQFRTAIHCAGEELNTYNVLDVNLAPGVALPNEDQRRSFYTTSSCGLCGKRSIESVRHVSSLDVELAAGFLVSEGIISAREQFRTAIHCAGEELNTYNVLDVNLAPGVALPNEDQRRSFYTTSSCGLCGKRSIESVRTVSSFDV